MKTCLGLELGSTRIKAVTIDGGFKPVSSGDYTWASRYENGVWTYPLEEVWTGLKAALSKVENRQNIAAAGVYATLSVTVSTASVSGSAASVDAGAVVSAGAGAADSSCAGADSCCLSAPADVCLSPPPSLPQAVMENTIAAVSNSAHNFFIVFSSYLKIFC